MTTLPEKEARTILSGPYWSPGGKGFGSLDPKDIDELKKTFGVPIKEIWVPGPTVKEDRVAFPDMEEVQTALKLAPPLIL